MAPGLAWWLLSVLATEIPKQETPLAGQRPAVSLTKTLGAGLPGGRWGRPRLRRRSRHGLSVIRVWWVWDDGGLGAVAFRGWSMWLHPH